MSDVSCGQRFQEQALVRFRRELSGGYFVLGLECPRLAEAAQPGQFAMLSVRPDGASGHDPLLPRPFTFLRARAGMVEVLIHAVGRGTALLAAANPGQRLRILGPLGHGFALPEDSKAQAIFVAGGIGVAPFLHFAERFDGRPRPSLLYGARSERDLHLLDELSQAMEVVVATEDGSRGLKGLVTGLLEPRLAAGEPLEVYTCGPEPMMAAVVRLCRGVKVQASLEARMACGVGVCRGCAVKKAQGGYLEVCADGPVRDGHELWG